KHPNTIIIDYDTNFDLINTPWNECLHPFLQLKYQKHCLKRTQIFTA
ncbi:unnamed protein product, partial [Rotaria sp. Silwood1]